MSAWCYAAIVIGGVSSHIFVRFGVWGKKKTSIAQRIEDHAACDNFPGRLNSGNFIEWHLMIEQRMDEPQPPPDLFLYLNN